MKEAEILRKAFKKAADNGMKSIHGYYPQNTEFQVSYKGEYFLFRTPDKYGERFVPEEFIFSHDFAKAFWGLKEVCINCGNDIGAAPSKNCYKHTFREERWEYCLKQMVLEEEPLKYLEKFL